MRTFIGALMVTACLGGVTHGDGCHFPQPAFPDIARVPAQRAFIAFRDSRETLIIESGLTSDSPRLGWVIPLPSVPTRIEPTDPGTLKTLSYCTPPSIVHDISGQMWAVLGVLCVFLVLAGIVTLQTNRERRLKDLTTVFMGLLIIAVLVGMFLPALGTARGVTEPQDSSGITMHKQIAVGDYQVTVVTAKTPADLARWLQDNSFGAPGPEAEKIVRDYIRAGWCFSAAKLIRKEGGTSTPHPLRFEFASKRAVYPMRLTALAKSEPHFELFVVGEQEALCDRLDREFVDRYRTEKTQEGERLIAKRNGMTIGHPELLGLMWDGCVLTKLSGRIPPEAMNTDIVFDWRPPEPYQARRFSRTGARQASVIFFCAGVFAVAVVSMLICRRQLRQAESARRYASHVLLPLVVIVIAASQTYFFLLPTIEVRTGFWLWKARLYHVRNLSMDLILADVKLGTDASVAEQRKTAGGILKQRGNPFTGAPVTEEASPGNYTIHEESGHIVVRLYDRTGAPHPIRFGEPPPTDETEGEP